MPEALCCKDYAAKGKQRLIHTLLRRFARIRFFGFSGESALRTQPTLKRTVTWTCLAVGRHGPRLYATIIPLSADWIH
jgi:hypothetical protein